MSKIGGRRLPSVPWTLWDVLWAVVLLVLGVAALNVELLLVLVLQLVVAGLKFPLSPEQRPLVVGTTVIAGEVLIFLSAWIFSVHRYGGDWRLLGYRAFRGSRAMPLAALVVLFGLGVNIVYVQIVSLLGRSDLLPQPVLPLLGQGPLAVIMLIMAASIAAPLAEETFFRGFVFSGVARRFGVIWGALVSSGMFALAHFQLGALAPIFLLGLALAWLYYRTGSLWPGIITHASYNSLAVLATLYGQQT